MLTISNQSNYLARIVKLENPKKHPNADRLQIWNVNGYEVITDMTSKEGDVKIFFPIECQINSDILSKLNLFSDKELNEDKEIAGYVHKSGRVRAIKLRDVMSEGMLLPVNEIAGAINGIFIDYDWSNEVGVEFDTLYDKVICQKYVPVINKVRSRTGTGAKKGPKVSDIIVKDQFRFHYDTRKLQDNIHKFDNEEDVIVITDKWHGTSAVFSNLWTKRKLSFWQRVGLFFGNNIKTEEYTKLYASRSVVKSIEDKYNVPNGGYYNSDIWGKVFNEVKDKLFPGITLYGEIVGYTGEKMIQKDYNYGCEPGEHKFLVYRITQTSLLGSVYEYSWEDILDFCKEHNLETVPVLFKGRLKDYMFCSIYFGENLSLLDILKHDFLEKDCQHCTKKVPAEGICIRNESSNKIAYKLKSSNFLLRETKSLDSGEISIEDQQ